MTTDTNGIEVPCTARELYSRELHRQRTRAGMSFQQLADVVNYSKPHVYGVELGTRMPLPPISAKFDVAFGTEFLFQAMYEAILRERPQKRFDHCLELEAKAIRIQEFSATLVPGLLQTEPYMRALFRRNNPGANAQEIDDWIAKRLSRQEVLRGDNPPDYWAVLDEAVIRRPVGGPAVMRDQLAAFLPLMETERTAIQIIPFEAGEYVCMNGFFVLLTSPDNSITVYNEGGGSGEAFDERAIVTRRVREYDHLQACALSPKASTALIEEAIERFDRCAAPQT
ncbi:MULTISPECIES: helix-turn-helix transcriptional regulator [unclassified Streptomyces]|uniref:helix-turn-helix domain-containing protein n=1 Tax=unclassified Streptomyces TaxID=2593676 RepID=UPI000DD7D1A2|nr:MULTISPECIES: helix-turn-helix transcriptional regulator [unclassified Streptomyces]QZZ27915.1 helix-turn-helix domain-containing protein [Streptomyces sp. ST1015]